MYILNSAVEIVPFILDCFASDIKYLANPNISHGRTDLVFGMNVVQIYSITYTGIIATDNDHMVACRRDDMPHATCDMKCKQGLDE
jgi:hypothetical protein